MKSGQPGLVPNPPRKRCQVVALFIAQVPGLLNDQLGQIELREHLGHPFKLVCRNRQAAKRIAFEGCKAEGYNDGPGAKVRTLSSTPASAFMKPSSLCRAAAGC